MIQLTKKFLGKGVVGFDVAGDEGNYPLSLYKDALEEACLAGIPSTCHAGEWPNSTENIRIAADVGVRRLGHALTLRSDPELMERISKLGIGVECCVVANLGWRGSSWEGNHPIVEMYNAGIPVSINSDNQLLSGTRARYANTQEDICHLVDTLGCSWTMVKQILLNGVTTSFSELPEDFNSRFETEIDSVFKEHRINIISNL
eukprot:TRINITY_DN1508_c0_g1_i2.p1 TRINITY_DN1508_c0_g1~~TRINITY_DN1508_c0_g1_i2.p1  ORF type:complete len:203 (+),score=24.76 TRINITY_DN1508_c0_g1_i2:550-1158(+)